MNTCNVFTPPTTRLVPLYAALGWVGYGENRVVTAQQVVPFWDPARGGLNQSVRFNRIHLSVEAEQLQEGEPLRLATEPGFEELPVESSTLHVLAADSCAGFTGRQTRVVSLSMNGVQWWSHFLGLNKGYTIPGQFGSIFPEFYVKAPADELPTVSMFDVETGQWVEMAALREAWPLLTAPGRMAWEAGEITLAELAVQQRWQWHAGGIYIGSRAFALPERPELPARLVDLWEQGAGVDTQLCAYPEAKAERVRRLLDRLWQTPARQAWSQLVAGDRPAQLSAGEEVVLQYCQTPA